MDSGGVVGWARRDILHDSTDFRCRRGSGEVDDALTMRGVEHNDHEKLTVLELVLQLHGEFRRSLEPIRGHGLTGCGFP